MFFNAPKNWKKISEFKVYSSEYIELFEEKLNLNGIKKSYIKGKRKNYSTIVPFISNNEILVIKSYRHIIDSIQTEVPSGYIEKNETAKNAAVRELKEETGYEANELVFIGKYTPDYSMFEQEGNIFVAYDLINKKEQSLGKMESITLDIVTISEIKNMLSNGEILNAASIVALYKAIDFHNNKIKLQ